MNLTVITLIETQGRFGNGQVSTFFYHILSTNCINKQNKIMTITYQGQEYVEQFMIEYKREDDKHWIKYRDRRGESVSISGNYLSRLLFTFSFNFFKKRFSMETLTRT